jgi:AhpD family alkylhydroperoxidase
VTPETSAGSSVGLASGADGRHGVPRESGVRVTEPSNVYGGPVPRITPGSRAQLGLVNTLITQVLGRMTRSGPPNVFTTLGRHRRLFRRWMFFASGLMPHGRLPRADTELVILRVAHNTACTFEWHHHERLGRAAGLSAQEIQRVRQGPSDPGWTPHQAALLAATDDLNERGRVGDTAWAALAAFLDEQDLIEFCMLAGHYYMLAMTLNTLNVQPDPPRQRR